MIPGRYFFRGCLLILSLPELIYSFISLPPKNNTYIISPLVTLHDWFGLYKPYACAFCDGSLLPRRPSRQGIYMTLDKINVQYYTGSSVSLYNTQRTQNVEPMSGQRWPTVCSIFWKLYILLHVDPEGEACAGTSSRHKTFTQCWFNVGPASQTVAQH